MLCPIHLVRDAPMIGIGGEPRGSAPPTPPYVRVRIRRFEKLRLTRFDQGWEAERFEVGIGEPHGEGFTSGEMPGSTAATGRIAQLPRELPARSVPLGDAVVFSIGARELPVVATGPSE